jgi:hypothetical protein
VTLYGWVIIWVAPHSDYPRMTSNIVDGDHALRMATDMLHRGLAAEIVAVMPAEGLRPASPCERAPAGWRCTRRTCHEGPCAAVPVPIASHA